YIPLATQPLKETDFAISILATAVLGSIAEHVLSTGGTTLSATERAAPNAPNGEAFRPAQLSGPLPPALRDLQGAFRLPGTAMPTALAEAAAPQKGAYEA